MTPRLSDFTPQTLAKWLELREVYKISVPNIALRYGVTTEMVSKGLRLARQLREAA